MPQRGTTIHREVALMFSRACNIACRHCGIESSPHVKERMPFDDARQYIMEAASLPGVGKVTFTGGEPFMFQAEHYELIKLATTLRLSTRVVTNGFWAKNKRGGAKLLHRMKEAGLRELNFSADKFHLEFMDRQILHNALECARDLGFARIVSFVTNSDEPFLDLFARMYDVPRERLVDLRQLLGTSGCTEDLDALKDDSIFVFGGGLIGLGRAAEHPDELRYFPVSFFPSGTPCSEVVNKSVIYPDGDLQACCCAGGKMSTFTVGNLRRESFATLYQRMLSRAQFRMINTHGPVELHRCIAQARPDRPGQDKYTSICELCVRSTTGLSAEEVDEIVEAALAAKMLTAWGFATPGAVETVPAPDVASKPRITLRVLS
jgi:organic radical activating enzyme